MGLTFAITNWLNPLLTAGDRRLEKLLLQHTEYHSAVQMKSLSANKLLGHTVVNRTAVLKDEMVALQDDKKAVTYTPQQMNSNTTDLQSQYFNCSNHRGEKQIMTDVPI